MTNIYVVRGSEDGTLDACHSAKKAAQKAVDYVNSSCDSANTADKSVTEIVAELRKGWISIVEGSWTSAEIEKF